MAVVDGIVTLSVIDGDNVPGSYSEYVQFADTLTAANLGSFIAALGPLVDAITTCQITGGEMRLFFSNVGAVKGGPASGSRVEDTGLFTFGILNSRYTQAIDVPGIPADKVVKGIITLTDSDVLAWEEFILTPTPIVPAKAKNGGTLTSINSGRETFRKHRRSLKVAASRPG